MRVSFEALHIAWKALAYLAAELRDGDQFPSASEEILELKAWQEFVAPWWDEYVKLLGEIPMSTTIDIETTDQVIIRLARHLQKWAPDIGYDLHDTNQGAWFQIHYPYLQA